MDKTVAAIEIKNSNFKLLIGYLFENKINVLYKKTYPLRISNKDGDIYDLNSLSEDLKQIKNISDPKKRLRVDINEVVLALPPFGLDVYEASKTTSTVDIDAKINKTDISNCLNMFKKLSYDTTNSSIVDIVPFAFSVDDNRTFFTPPLGETSKSLMINAHIYMMPTRIVDSFKKAIKNAGLEVSRVVIEPLGVNSLLNLNKIEYDNYLLVDYNKDNTVVSFLGNNRLYASKFFSVGGNEITKSIANSFEISMDKAEEIKCLYGLDLRETAFNAPILSVIGEDNVSRKHNIKELREIIEQNLVQWNVLFLNCINTLLYDYGDLKESIPLVFTGDATLLNGFKDFIYKNYPNNDVRFYSNDSIGALKPGDVNLLGSVAFVSTYKGSLEDEVRVEIKHVSRKKEKEIYREDEDEL